MWRSSYRSILSVEQPRLLPRGCQFDEQQLEHQWRLTIVVLSDTHQYTLSSIHSQPLHAPIRSQRITPANGFVCEYPISVHSCVPAHVLTERSSFGFVELRIYPGEITLFRECASQRVHQTT